MPIATRLLCPLLFYLLCNAVLNSSVRGPPGLLLLLAAVVGLPRVLHRRALRCHHPDHLLRTALHLQTLGSRSGSGSSALHFRLEQGDIVGYTFAFVVFHAC